MLLPPLFAPMLLRTLLAAAALLIAASGCGPQSYASSLEDIQVRPDANDPAWISVRLTGGAAKALRAKVGAEVSTATTEPYFLLALKERTDIPILARTQAAGNDVVLVPQAPLTRGQRYVVLFRGARLPGKPADQTREIVIPEDEAPSAGRVREVYPSLPELPANVFRFYVWFTEPMAEGKVFRHVRLLDAAGKPIPQALHEVELWAEDHRRLTLWLSPGRTKRALGITEHSGPVMEVGRQYTLEIGAGLPDRSGRPLAEPFRLPFRTMEPDHTQPILVRWKMTPPAAGSRDALTVTFPEPMDRPLALTSIWIASGSGNPVEGEATVAPSGREWTFTPKSPWEAAACELVIDGELDDLAGNSLYRTFETTAVQPKPAAEAPAFRLPFTPAPPKRDLPLTLRTNLARSLVRTAPRHYNRRQQPQQQQVTGVRHGHLGSAGAAVGSHQVRVAERTGGGVDRYRELGHRSRLAHPTLQPPNLGGCPGTIRRSGAGH